MCLCSAVWSDFVLLGMCFVLSMCVSVMLVSCGVSLYGVLCVFLFVCVGVCALFCEFACDVCVLLCDVIWFVLVLCLCVGVCFKHMRVCFTCVLLCDVVWLVCLM